jgi:hypothetical protein
VNVAPGTQQLVALVPRREGPEVGGNPAALAAAAGVAADELVVFHSRRLGLSNRPVPKQEVSENQVKVFLLGNE